MEGATHIKEKLTKNIFLWTRLIRVQNSESVEVKPEFRPFTELGTFGCPEHSFSGFPAMRTIIPDPDCKLC